MLNRSKLLAFVLLAGVFAAGLVAGAAVVAARSDGVEAPARGNGRGERRERGRERSYIGWLQAELTLVPTQRDTVERILSGYQGAMQEIWTEVRPRMDSIRAEIRAQIMAVLDSAQQDRYRALIARGDSGRRAERAREGNHEGNREGNRDR